jgi:hypothetical protein
MYPKNAPPWELAVLVAVAATFFILDGQLLLQLLAYGYDLRAALTAVGVLSAAAAEFAYRLLRLPSLPSGGAGPRGPFPA